MEAQPLTTGSWDLELEAGPTWCRHHPGVRSVDTCAGCGRGFCDSCLVHIRGSLRCAKCKAFLVRDLLRLEGRVWSPAHEALLLGIGSLVPFFGFLIAPAALFHAVWVLRLRRIRRMPDAWKAGVAVMFGLMPPVWILLLHLYANPR
jgi:hypothetical protein